MGVSAQKFFYGVFEVKLTGFLVGFEDLVVSIDVFICFSLDLSLIQLSSKRLRDDVLLLVQLEQFEHLLWRLPGSAFLLAQFEFDSSLYWLNQIF